MADNDQPLGDPRPQQDVEAEEAAKERDKAAELTPPSDALSATEKDFSPGDLVEHYRAEVRAQRIGRSRTGVARRIRADLEKGRKTPLSDERVDELVAQILA